jgi:pimeloyl-ACP methyl ester carboxylesterase
MSKPRSSINDIFALLSNFKMSFCEVNGHQIHYKLLSAKKITSESPCLVFLHEGLGSIAQWKDFPDKLCALTGLPGLLYDRYGYGKSEKLKEARKATFIDEAATVELPALLELLKIRGPLVLVGHSDGATIALWFAGIFPDSVSAVISEAAHVMLEDISRSGIKNTLKQFEETRLREFLERYHGDRTESMFYGWAHTWISGELDQWEMSKELRGIKAPVLAIQGLDDEYGSPEQIRWIEKYSGGPVEALLIPECGHIPHFQQQEKVLKKMHTFITANIK